MPGFDRTGPQGMGPMTGGAHGRCNPSVAGYATGRFGYGRGMAYGRGFRCGFGPPGGMGIGMRRGLNTGWYPYPMPAVGFPQYYPMSAERELDALKTQASGLKGVLDELNHRISELEKKN